MDSLQYYRWLFGKMDQIAGFKPCYKWIAFNTIETFYNDREHGGVLNLVING